MIKSIPTTYKGVNFRSRLEARWAVMFDALGWAWDYEPLDLQGYIPDFVLRDVLAEPLLIECKPFLEVDERVVQHCTKIMRSGWTGPALVVGSVLFPHNGAIGLGRMYDHERRAWSDGYLVRELTFNARRYWPMWREPCVLDADEILRISLKWADAGNVTQWKAVQV